MTPSSSVTSSRTRSCSCPRAPSTTGRTTTSSWSSWPSRRSAQRHGCADEVEEVVALVVDDDEGGEVLHLDPPHRLHAQLGVLEHLDLADAVLRQTGCRPTDRPEVEAA